MEAGWNRFRRGGSWYKRCGDVLSQLYGRQDRKHNTHYALNFGDFHQTPFTCYLERWVWVCLLHKMESVRHNIELPTHVLKNISISRILMKVTEAI